MKITENAPFESSSSVPFLLLRVNSHFLSVCIICYLSFCTIFRQVEISEVPHATLFCYSSVTATVGSQALAVITPSQPTGPEQFLWNAPAGSSVGKAHTLGTCPGSCSQLHPRLLPWGFPPQPALYRISRMDVMCRLHMSCHC